MYQAKEITKAKIFIFIIYMVRYQYETVISNLLKLVTYLIGQVSFAPEIVQVRKTMRARNGDSVTSIARRYATSPANVAQWNKINQNATFKAGQSVVIYVAMSAAGAKAEKSPQSAARTSEKPNARPVAKKLAPANVKQAKV
jgi:hypothetical protein